MMFRTLFAGMTILCMLYFLVLTRRSALQRLFVVAFFGIGTIFILQPGTTARLAQLVGIGRGADLIFYLSTLFLFFLCFNFYLRFKEIEARQSVLIRELALRNPRQPGGKLEDLPPQSSFDIRSVPGDQGVEV